MQLKPGYPKAHDPFRFGKPHASESRLFTRTRQYEGVIPVGRSAIVSPPSACRRTTDRVPFGAAAGQSSDAERRWPLGADRGQLPSPVSG